MLNGLGVRHVMALQLPFKREVEDEIARARS